MTTPEDRIVHWINERYSMFVLKENEHKGPLTEDPILHAYRFCNVHRENDRVTRWIRDHWRDVNAKESNLVPAMVLARMFNLPAMLQHLTFPYDWDVDLMTRRAKLWRDTDHKCFNGAYLITTCGVKMDKIEYVFRVANDVRNTWGNEGLPDMLSTMHDALTQTKGMGDFLAAQVVADLKNIPGHPLSTAPDRASWCAPGPGSLRGLKRLRGSTDVSRGSFMAQATIAYSNITPRLNPMPAIDMQDFQNCLCEFDKYERTYLGEGKPKQRYRRGE